MNKYIESLKSLLVDKSLHSELKNLAAEKGMLLTKIAEQAIKEYVDRNRKRDN